MTQPKPSPQGGGAFERVLADANDGRQLGTMMVTRRDDVRHLLSENERLKAEVEQFRQMYERAIGLLTEVSACIWPGPTTLEDGRVVDGTDAVKVRAHDAARAALTQAGGQARGGLSESLAVFADPALGMPKPKGQTDD